MSTNLIIAIVVLPLAGAAIAWAGDVIGYRLGKSRRSLFGLRPRTTARLVGILVGAALPLAGLLFAMAVSQDARDALLRIRELRNEAADLSRQNEGLKKISQKARQDARGARADARTASDKRARAEGHLAQAQTDLKNTSRSLTETKSSLSSSRSTLRTTQGTLGRVQDRLSDTRQHLSNTSKLLAAKEKLLVSYEAESEELKKIRREFEAAKEELDSLDLKLADKQEELEDYQVFIRRYRIERRAIMAQDVAFEPGDEVVRGFMESGWSTEQLTATLSELLLSDYANAAAASHGISPGPAGRSVAAVWPLPPGIPIRDVTEESIVAEVARQIARGDEPTYVVIVRAWHRAFENQAEPMTVELWAAPNKVVFEAGETVLTTTIDGSLPRGQVFPLLWQAIRGIRRIAANRGMLPSPKTGHYGEVPAEEMLATLDEILGIGGPAQLRIRTKSEARVAQPEEAPMLVELEVQRVPAE